MRVLIADDEEKVCILIYHLIKWEALQLEFLGFAYDGMAALDIISKEEPDIVITDIRMPGYSGLDVIRKATEINPDIEFIVVSGFKQFDYAKEALKYGVSNYLLKPIKEIELHQTLLKIKDRYQVKLNEASEWNRLKEQESQAVRKKRKDFFQNFLFSNRHLSLPEANLEFSYDFAEDYFRLGFLKIDGIQNIQHRTDYFEDKIEWLLGDHFSYCHEKEFIFLKGGFYILLNYSFSDEDIVASFKNLIHILRNQQDILKGFTVTVGLGKACKTLEELKGSIRDVERSIYQRLVAGTNRIIQKAALVKDEDKTLAFKEVIQDLLKGIELLDVEAIEKVLLEWKKQIIFQKGMSGELLVKNLKQVFEAYQFGLQRAQLSAIDHDLWTKFWCEAQYIGSAEELLDKAIGEICFLFKVNLSEKEAKDSKPISEAKKYIIQNLSSPITLEEVSEATGFTTAYFSRMFKQKTGETFSDYVFKKRMEEAKKFIRETDFPISQICEEIGYLDKKQFTKNFKKYTDLTPRDYRKLYS